MVLRFCIFSLAEGEYHKKHLGYERHSYLEARALSEAVAHLDNMYQLGNQREDTRGYSEPKDDRLGKTEQLKQELGDPCYRLDYEPHMAHAHDMVRNKDTVKRDERFPALLAGFLEHGPMAYDKQNPKNQYCQYADNECQHTHVITHYVHA